ARSRSSTARVRAEAPPHQAGIPWRPPRIARYTPTDPFSSTRTGHAAETIEDRVRRAQLRCACAGAGQRGAGAPAAVPEAAVGARGERRDDHAAGAVVARRARGRDRSGDW